MSAILQARVAAEGSEPIDEALADTLSTWLDCHQPWFHATLAALSAALRDGHTCLYLPDWAGCAMPSGDARADTGFGEPTVQFPELDDWCSRLEALGLGPEAGAPVVLDRRRLYLRRYWRFETELAATLRERLADCPAVAAQPLAAALERLFPEDPQSGSPDYQKRAAANAALQRVSVIAGGPGTGKTHTVTRLLALLIEAWFADGAEDPPRIHLAAPTGKAAQRLAESVAAARSGLQSIVAGHVVDAIPEQATTLHRLLRVRGDGSGFRHDRDHPLALDVLVVDEISMVDLPLMARLFRALPAECRIILLGDADQLPSVAAGSVLADLVERPHPGYSPARRQQLEALGFSELPAEEDAATAFDHLSLLHESRRFQAQGGIGRLAAQVIAGDAEVAEATLAGGAEELRWRSAATLADALREWIDAYYRPIRQAPDLATAFARLERFRILCPMRGGPTGVDALNEQVLRVLNPGQRRFFAGQPVMVQRNHYALGLFNGDIGLVWPDTAGQLLVWFPDTDGYRPIAPGRLPDHETVYAMTIHKTQGSEFDRLALILPDQPSAILTRELIYTGVTRARGGLEVIGAGGIWRSGIQQRVERYSGLKERLFAL